MSQIDATCLPRHIAIIMDGNGRWAKKRGMPRIYGHREGIATVRATVTACSDLGIEVLTLYAFSTENWIRPRSEVGGLMKLLEHFLRKEAAELHRKNVRVRVIGDVAGLPAAPRSALQDTMRLTGNNSGMILNLALNYGGRQEIARAVNSLLKSGAKKVSVEEISGALDTAGLPDPDLLIRTSGEMRLSNFMLWQLAYTEFYITPKLWPDFKEKDLREAIAAYQSRERRYGGV